MVALVAEGSFVAEGSPVARSETIRIGRVVRAHGLLGELEVRPDWTESRGLLEASEVMLESEAGQVEVRRVNRSRQTPKGVLMQLAGITDRNAAEARRGFTVLVNREKLPTLADGEYYLCDLVGLEVYAPGGLVGKVVDVQMYPSVDSMTIETPSGGTLEQPLLDEWIERVDAAAGRITLASLDGAIEGGGSASPADREGS